MVFAVLPVIAYQELRLGEQANFYRLAIAYGAAIGLLLWVLGGLLLNLRRLDTAVRGLAADSSLRLSTVNRLPDLDGVAREFDRMAESLRLAGETSRIAAAENAHAFKTPIATITHALTPLRNAVAADHIRGRRSIELIEMTVDRLDALVMASRQMEETFARTLHPSRDRIELSAILRHRMSAHEAGEGGKAVRLASDISPGIVVDGNADLICAAVDNILENAVRFTRPGGEVTIGLRREGASALCHVDDEGPGAPGEDVERIFERYYTYRPAAVPPAARADFECAGNFGTGLWIARRSIEALGGKVWAERRPVAGMRILISLPLAGS